MTEPGFFGRQVTTVVPSHDWSHVPLGKALVHERGSEVIADISFNLKVPAAIDWFESIKYDFENPPALQQYSYGFTIRNGGSRPGEFEGQRVRFLQPLADGSPGVDVHEVSPVLLGAGVGVRTLAVKHDRRRRGIVEADGLDATTKAQLQAYRAELERDESNELKRMRSSFLDDVERATATAELKDAAVAAGLMIGYREAAKHEVRAETRTAAEQALAARAPGVTARYFTEEKNPARVQFIDTPMHGFCRPGAGIAEVWVRSDLNENRAYEVAAHELAHLLDGADEVTAQAAGLRALFERGWL
ncbi:hypothetical protein O3S80_21435 [Streptomyces sp. Lzd4kr]|nr:hypothetical protein [Streptomyces sp. Lzd4kr]